MINIILTVVIGIAVVIASRLLLIRAKNSDKIHRRFFGQLLGFVVFLFCVINIIELINPSMNLRSIFLKGSALVVAIVGFAAQPAISDLICGFLISVNKPFEIGDRITVEGMEPGIVEDITLRHTVIRIYDGLKVIIPNSVLNGKTVINSTQNQDRRGIHLTFSVSYDTNVRQAMDVIRDCVAESPYTLSVENNGIKEDSGPVYFLKFADSALILETTIWINNDMNSYTAITDVNIRVNNAFKAYGIEIPYNFINVVEREMSNDDETVAKKKKKTSPSKRSVRTDTVKMEADTENMGEAMRIVRDFATRQRLSDRNTRHLELMTEEIIGVIASIVQSAKTKFWIEGSGQKYRIHLSFPASVGSEEYKRLIALSTSGKNEAVRSLSEKIWEKMIAGIRTADTAGSSSGDYEWSLHGGDQVEDDLGESILNALADNIKVSVTKDHVELVVVKLVKD
ncbi:MAG: mechanosensitive ion channel family protein [Lachnospiraceae bacterium]|nr:mechanosensitive ion channel family protein [Lachnospiraceae bacterium]